MDIGRLALLVAVELPSLHMHKVCWTLDIPFILFELAVNCRPPLRCRSLRRDLSKILVDEALLFAEYLTSDKDRHVARETRLQVR